MENVVLNSFRKFKLIYIIIILNILSLISGLYSVISCFYNSSCTLNNEMYWVIIEVIMIIPIIIYILLAIVKDKEIVKILITILFITSFLLLLISMVSIIINYFDFFYLHYSFIEYLINFYKMSLINVFINILYLVFLFSLIVGLFSKNKDKFKIFIMAIILINFIGNFLFALYSIYDFCFNLIIKYFKHELAYYLNSGMFELIIVSNIIHISLLITWSVLMVVFFINIQRQFNCKINN